MVHQIETGSCGVRNPSFQAAVGLSGHDKSESLKSVKTVGCAYVSPPFQAAVPYSNSHHGSKQHSTLSNSNTSRNGSAIATNKPGSFTSTNDYQPTTRRPRASSVSTKFRPNPDFLEFVPVKSEFRDRKSLPKSMADLSLNDEMVNFYPVSKKGKNYLRYCIGWLSNDEIPSSVTECVRKYTSGPNWYCTEVNMALAADSPRLSEYGPYIRELKYSIGKSRMNFNGTVFRGADMSPREIAAYESKTMFFIPSFTSTSKKTPFHGKNTLIHVDITPEWSKFCMEIRPRHTDYPEEEEVLFSCYNLYKYLRTEKSNGQRIIKLELVNYDRYFDYRSNCIVDGSRHDYY